MLLTTTCGPSVSQGQQKIPTIQTIKRVVILILNAPAMISTTDLTPRLNVNSNTSVLNVCSLVTTNNSVTTQVVPPQQVLHPQLQECNFSPVTQIKYQILNRLLRDHPNRNKVNYVVQGFQSGFSLKYNGPLENRQPKNLLSAYCHADKLWSSIMKEV